MEPEWIDAGVGRRTKKTEKNQKGWQEIDFKDVKLNSNKKTILFFGGNGATTCYHANGSSKIVESLIGQAEQENYDLFSFYYGHFKEDTTGFFNFKEEAKIYNAFFRPLVCDEKGKVFDEKQIKKNLSNLVLVGHCKGAEVCDTFLGDLKEFLSAHFEEEKAEKLLQNTLVVCFEPHTKNVFGTTVNFISMRDPLSVDPHYALNRGKPWRNDPEFLGVAKVFKNKQKTGLEVFSNSFVNLQTYQDEHHMALIRKKNGIIDREFLPNFDLTQPNKRPGGYSRQQAISDLFALALAYGITAKSPNLKELSLILENQVQKENKTIFEQEQKALFKEKQKGGRALEKVLKESGLKMEDVLAGKVRLSDLKIPWCGVKQDDVVSKALFSPLGKQSFLGKRVEEKKHAGYGSAVGRYNEASFDKTGKYSHKSLVATSGSNLEYVDENSAIKMQILGEDLSNSIFLTTTIFENKQEQNKNKIDVDVGVKFKEKSFHSAEEMKKNVEPSFLKKRILSPEQTRVLLNEAVAANVPFENICFGKNIQPNQEVINNSVHTDQNGLVVPNTDENEVQTIYSGILERILSSGKTSKTTNSKTTNESELSC